MNALEELKELLAKFNIDNCEENFKEVISFLTKFLDEENTIYIAGNRGAEGISLKQVENEGKKYMLAFTSPDEAKGDVLGFQSRKLFDSISGDEEVEGLVINPYSDCFVIGKSLLSLLLDLTLYRTTPPMNMN